jgi:hypothetical protein
VAIDSFGNFTACEPQGSARYLIEILGALTLTAKGSEAQKFDMG